MSLAKESDMTNARRFTSTTMRLLARLKGLMAQANCNAWAMGDLVNQLKRGGMTVQEQAALIGGSRQRLSELRRTAAAFGVDQRRLDVEFHFHTVAMRSAKRLGLAPSSVLDELVKRGIDSTRAATRHLAARLRQREARRAAGAMDVSDTSHGVLNRCHHADFRLILPQVAQNSVTLVIADPPYGRYGRYRDGQHTRVTATQRDCDGLDDESARALTEDLFRLCVPLLRADGCLLLFRPGGLADPVWLMEAAAQHGWECRHALAWRRGPAKLGDGQAPYTSATERIMVFAQSGAMLVNHDGSSQSDVIEVKAKRKSYLAPDQHLFEKPVDLMATLISKHTYPNELVVEPFGGTGSASRGAIRLGRQWLYCETNRVNYQLCCRLMAKEVKESQQAG